MGNNSTLVIHKGYDWNLSYSEKLMCFWFCMACSLIPLIGYSIPNTMHTAFLIGKGSTRDLFGLTISGVVILQSFAIVNNIAEIACIYLIIWKGGWYYWTGLIVTMAISISGSFVFHDQAQQEVNFKKDQIASYADAGKRFDELITQQNEAIASRREQIASLNIQEQGYRDEVSRGTRPKVPDFIAYRKRVAAEEIQTALRLQSAYADSAKKYSFGATAAQDSAGYMVDFGVNSKKISMVVSIVIEVFLVCFAFLAILLRNSVAVDRAKGNRDKNISMDGFTDTEDGVINTDLPNLPGKSKPASITLADKNIKRSIGFARHDDKQTTVDLRCNSEELILYYWDLAIQNGSNFTVRDISRITAKSETWVRQCLKNNNRLPKRGEA